jgi:hypothetical protein
MGALVGHPNLPNFKYSLKDALGARVSVNNNNDDNNACFSTAKGYQMPLPFSRFSLNLNDLFRAKKPQRRRRSIASSELNGWLAINTNPGDTTRSGTYQSRVPLAQS